MKKIRKVGITEVVLRDGIQSILATRVALRDLVPIIPALDKVGYWSMETWGGATYDACIRYLDEDPWERLRVFSQLMPNTPQQMLIRGQNLVGYRHYSNKVVSEFLDKSAENGIDVFRTFDALNDFNNIEFTIKEVKRILKDNYNITGSLKRLDGEIDYNYRVHFSNDKDLIGLNVTIPYKEKIIPYLDKLSTNAEKIGAVNTIYFENKKIIGDNTDIIGFEIALKSFMKKKIYNAVILGTGGASKAINFVLKNNDINTLIVSRKPKKGQIHYKEINKDLLLRYPLIINCTPLGTAPRVNELPPLPYELINSDNYLFDLIYNPKITLFMKKGLNKGAKVTNGLKMLIAQAEASWKLWE